MKDAIHTPKPHGAYERLARIETPRLFLRPMERTDTDAIVAWRSEPETARMFVHRPPTRAEHEAWFESARIDRVDYVLVRRETGAPIGVVNYKDLNATSRSAETGTLIGDASSRRQGFAREAKVAWMLYGFAELALDAVFVHVRTDNARMLDVDAALGYVRVAETRLDTVDAHDVSFVRMRLDAATVLDHSAYRGPDPHGFRAKLAERLHGADRRP